MKLRLAIPLLLVGLMIVTGCGKSSTDSSGTSSIGGLNPTGAKPEQVDAFLKAGGTNWQSQLDQGKVAGGEDYWIWPVADQPIASDGRLRYVPFQVHWKLRPDKKHPVEELVSLVVIQNRPLPVRQVLPPDQTEGVLQISIDAQTINGRGSLPFMLATTKPGAPEGQTEVKPASNIVLFNVQIPNPNTNAPADKPEEMEKFLKAGGQNWQTPVEKESNRLAGGEDLWLWPLQDLMVQGQPGQRQVPVALRWKLRPGKKLPTAEIRVCFEAGGQAMVMQHKVPSDLKEGVFNCILDTQQVSGQGQFVCYVTPGDAQPDEKKTADKPADEKKPDDKKADAKKADEKKPADEKKADAKKSDDKKVEAKKADEKATDASDVPAPPRKPEPLPKPISNLLVLPVSIPR